MRSAIVTKWTALVARDPGEPALYSPDGTPITRGDIEERSECLRADWESSGLKPRRIIALRMLNGPEWISSFLACVKLGAVPAPIDPGAHEKELGQIAADLRVQAVWDGVSLERATTGRPFAFRSNRVSVVKLTSGSTGLPRKLAFSEEEMVSDASNLIRCMGIREGDINLGLIPWGHSYGLGSIVYPLILQGTRACWTDSPYPSEIASVCRRNQCTIFPAVPAVIRGLSRSDCLKDDLSSLRLVISAGARLEPSLAREFLERFGKRVHNFYGSSETGGICYDQTGDAALSGRSVGKPIDGVAIIPGRGKRFSVESAAVYRHGNRRVSSGNRASALMADYGYLSEDGELILENRVRSFMKIGARRISPTEVELRIREIEAVADVIVFALERQGQMIIAAAIESSAEREKLSAEIRKAVPLRLRPKKWIVYDRFPRTERGKADFASIKRDFS